MRLCRRRPDAADRLRGAAMNKPDTRLSPRRDDLPWQEVSLDVLREKYAKGAERDLDGPEMARAVRLRVARALAAVEADPARWEPVFLEALEDGFIPGGRINSAAGLGHPRRHADQLLRATGGRFGLRDRRRQARHLHRAARGGRDHAPRRRRRLRLLGDPPARRAGPRHRQRRLGADQLHARLRPVLRHGRERRRPPRRADGRAALRPSRHHGVRRRQAAGGQAQQLQHLGRASPTR